MSYFKIVLIQPTKKKNRIHTLLVNWFNSMLLIKRICIITLVLLSERQLSVEMTHTVNIFIWCWISMFRFPPIRFWLFVSLFLSLYCKNLFVFKLFDDSSQSSPCVTHLSKMWSKLMITKTRLLTCTFEKFKYRLQRKKREWG